MVNCSTHAKHLIIYLNLVQGKGTAYIPDQTKYILNMKNESLKQI